MPLMQASFKKPKSLQRSHPSIAWTYVKAAKPYPLFTARLTIPLDCLYENTSFMKPIAPNVACASRSALIQINLNETTSAHITDRAYRDEGYGLPNR